MLALRALCRQRPRLFKFNAASIRCYTMPHTPPALKDSSLFIQDKCFINGKWVSAKSRETFEVNDPATGSLVGTCANCAPSDSELAINAAAAAFPAYSRKQARERARLLRRWYEQLVANAEDIATLITWENGKPLVDARGEAAYAASFLEWFSEEAVRIYGDTVPATIPGNRVLTRKEPIGPVGIITPWNFPAAMITRKVAPALATGCSVVAKTPSETPFTANAIAELGHRAGVPPGVVNVVSSNKHVADIGAQLTTHPAIRKVSFTGSTTVGKLLMKQSSSTLKKLSLELGGNAPFIVFDDVEDIDAAVAGAITSKFRSSGQTCICANRIFVQRGIYDEFAKRFVAKVKQHFKLGYGFTQGTTHGPLIHEKSLSKITRHVNDAVEKGGKIQTGGQLDPALRGLFYEPTVITGMRPDMMIASEETFGPVAGLFPFSTEKEVVELANSTEVGLAAYFYSRDLKRTWRVAEALQVGMVGVNTGILSDPALPFGGVKESGFGREGSKYGVDEYLTVKAITLGGMDEPLQG